MYVAFASIFGFFDPFEDKTTCSLSRQGNTSVSPCTLFVSLKLIQHLS